LGVGHRVNLRLLFDFAGRVGVKNITAPFVLARRLSAVLD
jgi:hypothetical protein